MIDKDEIPETIDLMLGKLQEIERRVGVLEQATRVGWPYEQPDHISKLTDRVEAIEKALQKYAALPTVHLPPKRQLLPPPPPMLMCTQHPDRNAIRQILIDTFYGAIPTASFCEECDQASRDQKQEMVEACYAKYAEENKEILKRFELEVIFPSSVTDDSGDEEPKKGEQKDEPEPTPQPAPRRVMPMCSQHPDRKSESTLTTLCHCGLWIPVISFCEECIEAIPDLERKGMLYNRETEAFDQHRQTPEHIKGIALDLPEKWTPDGTQ